MTTIAAETFASEEIKNKYQNSPYRIPLRNRAGVIVEFALVEEQDFERVNDYKWHLNTNGYAAGHVKRQSILLHHFILKKPDVGYVIDHINQDKLDNQLSNLRQISYSENAQNKSRTITDKRTSKYIGVSYDIKGSKYVSRYATKKLYYGNERDAAIMYDIYTFQTFGEHAYNNRLITYQEAMKYNFEVKEKPKRDLPTNIEIVMKKGKKYFRVRKKFNKKLFIKDFILLEDAIKKLYEVNFKINLSQVINELKHLFSPIQRNKDGIAIIIAYENKHIFVSDEDWHKLSKMSWCITNQGYAQNGKGETMHKILCPSKDPKKVVHHINGVRTDNRRENLAIVSRTVNAHQKKKTSNTDTTSKYVGVDYDKRRNNWKARIRVNGKSIHLGRYEKEEDAAKAYDAKAIEIYGKVFANLNFRDQS